VTVEPVKRHGLAEPQNERTIADRARETQAIRRVGGDENRMTWRAGHVPAKRIVPRKHAADRQYHDVYALPLDIAASVGHWARRERTDLERVACEQCPADGVHDLNLKRVRPRP
jgi:hypothetical protein